MPTQAPSLIVGIGGSAGGLDAYKALVDALPGDTGMAFVFVYHFIPTAESHLAALLSRRTKMPVEIASDAMPVRANHLYVCPPNVDLTIEQQSFKLSSPRTRNQQIDLFFTSLAQDMGMRAVGVILSGYDRDGTEGCRQIKAKGGMTFAQDLSAEVGDMALSAQAAGCVDFVLPPGKIPAQLRRLLRSRRA